MCVVFNGENILLIYNNWIIPGMFVVAGKPAYSGFLCLIELT